MGGGCFHTSTFWIKSGCWWLMCFQNTKKTCKQQSDKTYMLLTKIFKFLILKENKSLVSDSVLFGKMILHVGLGPGNVQKAFLENFCLEVFMEQ